MRFVTVLLTPLLLAGLSATAAHATLEDDLTALDASADALIAGGTLEPKQVKAANRVVKAVEKARSVADDPQKLLKKSAAAVKRVEQAGRKGVDLMAEGGQVLDGIVAWAEQMRGGAETGRDILQVEKDFNRVDKGVQRGKKKADKGDLAPTDSKKAKLYASAGKLWAKAAVKSSALLAGEIEKGTASVEVVSTSLDGVTEIGFGEPILIEFNVLVTLNLSPNAIVVERAGGGETRMGTLAPATVGDAPEYLFLPEPPLDSGDWVLWIVGLDTSANDFVRTDQAIPLRQTVTKSFTVLP